VTRILLVDDHPIVRLAVRQLFANVPDFAICGEADSVDDALDAARALEPDLVVVDLSLKGVGGLELIRQLVTIDARLPVVVFSMYDDKMFAEPAFTAGARGYVTKQERPDALVRAIRQVLAGGRYPDRPPAET
jgi:two-component system invasion response regulator UvrY